MTQSDLIIRDYVHDDFAQVTSLWQACGLTRPWNDPAADIALIEKTATSCLLVGLKGETVVATTMAGFDGHRGWIYYVAVRPDLQGLGFSRQVVTAAEVRLKDMGCPKVELLLRSGNEAATAVYRALGYRTEDRLLMAKWLNAPPSPQIEPARGSSEPRIIDLTVTYLEMTSAPKRAPVKPPAGRGTLSLQRVPNPPVHYYRYLQHTVGDPWLWWDRRTWSDEKLASVIHDPAVEIYVLSENGAPAGFVELDFRSMQDHAEIAYYGLFPHAIGRRLGPYLLDWAIHCAWNREPRPQRLQVNTCTLDHPKALPGYQRAGFEVVKREETSFPDPVDAGHIPPTVKILTPGYQSRPQ